MQEVQDRPLFIYGRGLSVYHHAPFKMEDKLGIEEHTLAVADTEDDTLLLSAPRTSSRYRCNKKLWIYAKANMLLILTVVAVVLGVVLGLAIKPTNPSQLAQELISFPGEIFLRALKMLILPLIVFSLMAGLGSLDIKVAGAIGIRTLVYYGMTTFLAVVLGLILVLTIRPGDVNAPSKPCDNHTLVDAQQIDTLDSILDLARYENDLIVHVVD